VQFIKQLGSPLCKDRLGFGSIELFTGGTDNLRMKPPYIVSLVWKFWILIVFCFVGKLREL
jgi:hypothetical protein